MSIVEVDGDGRKFKWTPGEPDHHYPEDRFQKLSINLQGQHNVVDTAMLGFDPIEHAYKPSLKVVLKTKKEGVWMTFGASFNRSLARDFAADNVGVTPLIRVGTKLTEFLFQFDFESDALSDDG
jgi:hypothetical protein